MKKKKRFSSHKNPKNCRCVVNVGQIVVKACWGLIFSCTSQTEWGHNEIKIQVIEEGQLIPSMQGSLD